MSWRKSRLIKKLFPLVCHKPLVKHKINSCDKSYSIAIFFRYCRGLLASHETKLKWLKLFAYTKTHVLWRQTTKYLLGTSKVCRICSRYRMTLHDIRTTVMNEISNSENLIKLRSNLKNTRLQVKSSHKISWMVLIS